MGLQFRFARVSTRTNAEAGGAGEERTSAGDPAGTPAGVQFKRYHGAKLMMEDSVFAELELVTLTPNP